MGSSKTAFELARKFERAAVDVRKANEHAVLRVARSATTGARVEIGSATRGSMFLRNVGKKGRKVGARYKVLGPDLISVEAVGPLQIIERDTKPHDLRKRSRRRASRANPGPVQLKLSHPGTKGKHPFAKGVTAGLAATSHDVNTEINRALGSIFRR